MNSVGDIPFITQGTDKITLPMLFRMKCSALSHQAVTFLPISSRYFAYHLRENLLMWMEPRALLKPQLL